MWNFETEPEFQRKLDWIEQFVRERIEPLDYLFPKDETYNTRNEALMTRLSSRARIRAPWPSRPRWGGRVEVNQ